MNNNKNDVYYEWDGEEYSATLIVPDREGKDETRILLPWITNENELRDLKDRINQIYQKEQS